MKESDSYVFTSEANHSQMLSRKTITKDVNQVMPSVSNQFTEKPNITSHSFRVGYITQLWKDTKDIEFVKQTIGHRSLNSTSGYVSDMTDQERQNRISSIKSTVSEDYFRGVLGYYQRPFDLYTTLENYLITYPSIKINIK